MATQPTPGPWYSEGNRVYSAGSYGRKYNIARCSKEAPEAPFQGGTVEANARLIAAAPTMLEALELAEPALWVLVSLLPEGAVRDDAVAKHNAIRDAISKAA